MRGTSILRIWNLKKLPKLAEKALANTPQYVSKVKQEQQKIVLNKIKDLNEWYTGIIGLDAVQVTQNRATNLQDKLLNTQAKRRELSTQLETIKHEAKEIHNLLEHIDRTKRFDEYNQLILKERAILIKERSIWASFQESDQAERELFTASTNAIRDSQEKIRAQLEYSKYIGLVFSLIGSFLAFIYTYLWKQDIKKYIEGQITSLKPKREESRWTFPGLASLNRVYCYFFKG